MAIGNPSKKSLMNQAVGWAWTALGAFLVALSIKTFLAPAGLIDGGIVGVSMIASTVCGHATLPYFLLLFNIPFLILGYRRVGRRFVLHMLGAVLLLALFSFLLDQTPPFEGDVLEVIVFGGLCLGIGTGIVIRMGGALDGTEILAILWNRKRGFTVGQVVFFLNIFIFALAGLVEGNYHAALRSFMAYIVAYKIMDTVIVGFDETKAARIMTANPSELADTLVHQLGLGVTILYGRGGYSGEDREILYVIVERVQLAQLKELVAREDPTAFMAVENLHEVVSRPGVHITQKTTA